MQPRNTALSIKFLLAALLVWLPTQIVAAEPGRVSIRQPEFLEQYAVTNRFSNGRAAGMEITRAGDAVLFLRSGPRSFQRDLYEFDVATGAERVLLTSAQILGGAKENLTDEEKARRERMRLTARGITSFQISHDDHTLLLPLSGKLYLVDRKTAAVRQLVSTAGSPVDPQFSPDGKRVACVRGNELYVTDVDNRKEKCLTSGATATITHGLAEFVAQEEMGRMHGYWWSPDSRQLVYQETDTSGVEELSIADQAHPERPAQTWPYPRAGKNNAKVRLGIISADGGETKWLLWDTNEFPYLARVSWAKNAPLVILVQNREQTLEVLYEVDPASGEKKELLRESDAAWLNLDGEMPKWLPDGKAFLWSTERRGGWQLELHKRDGNLDRVLTSPELNYRHLAAIDEAANAAIVAGGPDPTQTQIYRVSLEKVGQPEPITHEPGVHAAIISEESGVSVRSWQSLSSDAKQVVFRRDGSTAGELKSMAEKPGVAPAVELVEIGSEPRMHAAIVRPHDFRPGTRYPVIVSVYAGPHAQMVLASRARYLLDAWLANQGFVVVSVDGRGTPARGRAWERVIKGNFIQIPLADQVHGLQALGKKYPELDLTRVGIFGWSFGGYFTAMAMMQRPDVFHAGVAGAPVTDWHDYDTHYTERYLGLPAKDPHAYQISSALESAHELRRPLLLIHGTADDNVFFMHSIKLTEALFHAGREFNFLPLAGKTHVVADPPTVRDLYSRIGTYFLEHLGATRDPIAKTGARG
jgi:dipeptidyl-peptidase-4